MKEKFGRWNILFIQYLKRDWKKIIIWIIGLGLFASGFIPAFKEIAKDGGSIGMYEVLKNPAMISIIGPTPIDLANEYTLGPMYAHEMLLFSALISMIISILHTVSHSRKEEDLGLTELVRSFPIGRQGNSLAIIIETVLINIVLAIFIFGIMISFKADTITIEGALLFGISIALAGIIGAAIGLFMAQIMPSSSGATGASLSFIGLLYILRGMTDIYNIKLSVFNPIGWTYLTYPFTENNWMPIIFALIFTLIVIVMSFILEGKRDMGGAYLPQQEGRAYGRKSLLSVPGLFLRLNRGLIISWLGAFFILGAAYGAIYGDMGSFIQDNELLKQMFTASGISIEESFTSTVMSVMVTLITILPIAIINRLFSEEKNLYLSQIYGTKIKRGEFYWTNIIFAIISGKIGILLTAIGLGGAAIFVMEDGLMNLSDFFAIGFNLFPSILFFIALAALVLGFLPKLGKIVYGYLTYTFVIDYFSAILDLPNWIQKTTPQSYLPKMPIEDFDIKVFAVVIVISLVFIIIGYFGYKNRDIIEGG